MNLLIRCVSANYVEAFMLARQLVFEDIKKKQTEATTTILTAASASIAASTAAVLHLKRGIRFFWMAVSAVSTKTPTAVSAVLYLCEKHIQLF